MKYLLIAFFLLIATPGVAQDINPPTEPEPTHSQLVAQVRDIAALAVANTDGLAELRSRVASLDALRDKIAGMDAGMSTLKDRIFQLENKVFEIPTIVNEVVIPRIIERVVERRDPTWITDPPEPIVKTIYPRTVTKTGGRTVTPLRRVFRCLFRRRLSNVTIGQQSSGHWSFPGRSIASHLIGPPHYVSSSYVNSMTSEQQLSLHDFLHDN